MTDTHGTIARLALVLTLALPTAMAPGPARADIMAACSAEIGSLCADVAEGRGRIAACLVGNRDSLSADCQPEVQTLAQRTSRNVLMPSEVRTMLSPGFQADLPQSCQPDASQFCSGVAAGDGRVFACLYARGDRVSETCSADVEQTLKR